MGKIMLNDIEYCGGSNTNIDITTTLDENSTDAQAASAKAVYEKLQNIDAETVNGFSIFTAPSQLGISSWYIPDIVQAMPENSMFIVANTTLLNSTEANNALPNPSGTLEITRPRADIGRTRVVYYSGVNADKYSVYICNLDEENWIIKGWKHIGDGCNADTLDGLHASDFLPLTGGKVKGTIYFDKDDGSLGYGRIYQDHNSGNNYGLTLRDYDKNGNYVALRVCSAGDGLYFCTKDTINKEVIHTGNMETYIGKNIPKTVIQFTNSTNWSIPNTNLETFFICKNGWCFLHVVAHCNKVANDDNSIVFTGLPTPPFQVYGNFVGSDNTYEPCQLTVGTDGRMLLRGGTVGKDYSFTYTYPVV